jgi:hypothetical protein
MFKGNILSSATSQSDSLYFKGVYLILSLKCNVPLHNVFLVYFNAFLQSDLSNDDKL